MPPSTRDMPSAWRRKDTHTGRPVSQTIEIDSRATSSGIVSSVSRIDEVRRLVVPEPREQLEAPGRALVQQRRVDAERRGALAARPALGDRLPCQSHAQPGGVEPQRVAAQLAARRMLRRLEHRPRVGRDHVAAGVHVATVDLEHLHRALEERPGAPGLALAARRSSARTCCSSVATPPSSTTRPPPASSRRSARTRGRPGAARGSAPRPTSGLHPPLAGLGAVLPGDLEQVGDHHVLLPEA